MHSFAADATWPATPQPALKRAVWLLVGASLVAAAMLYWATASFTAALGLLTASALCVAAGTRAFAAGSLQWRTGACQFVAHGQTDSALAPQAEPEPIARLVTVLRTPWGLLLSADQRWLWLRAPSRGDAARQAAWRAMLCAVLSNPRNSDTLGPAHG
jgi:hypothetical protein